MLSGKPRIHIYYLNAIITGVILVAFGSCTVVKKYPEGKPFVYKTNINLIGNFSNEEKKELESALEGQLDDSMQVRRLDQLYRRLLRKPPVYDSANADKSIIFMRALLKSRGYFSDSIYYTHTTKLYQGKQLRTTIDFFVRPGKLVHLDTVTYNLRSNALQKLADSTRRDARVKKGDPFAKDIISAELDRLTDLYRNNGYLRFNRDELVGLWDTLDVALLQPTLDPFEQLEILQRLRQRRENPTANLEIRLRSQDSSRLTKYYVGNITVYPDITADTAGLIPSVKVIDGVRVIQHHNRFKAKIFPPNIYLRRDSIYRQRRYLETINRFNLLGTWRLVNIDQVIRRNEDTVDFVIRLTTAPKYSFNTNLEGSINQSAISGNLFGVGANVGLQNRNFAKGANTANTNVRYGIELGFTEGKDNSFIQSKQLSLSHSIYFPRFIPNSKFIPDRYRDNLRTVFTFNAANTERRLLYNLTTINGAWGYEYSRRNWLATIKVPNIEYSYLIRRDSLQQLIDNNPSLRNVFTDGFISSIVGNLTISGGKNNVLNVLRINIEEAGLLTGLLRNSFLDRELYRFLKVDFEFARLIRFPKSSVALRAFAGVGYEFDFTRNPDKRNNLPFFKQYFAGGPNSMRAWALRRLGPGSSVKQFTGSLGVPDRYGDVQLEANVEYRFPIGSPFGLEVNGAFFTDIGNVWFLKSSAGLPEERINLSRLGKDIAIGAGGGVRVDLNFFVIRFDYSYKVKDPSPDLINAHLQNKWFGYKFFDGDQFQLGINYPFIF
jgi:outer membrane protein insertion porin family